MFQRLRLLVTDQYRREAKKWLETIGRKESLSISFFPKTDRIIRFEQLLSDKELLGATLGQSSRYLFALVDFSAPAVEDSTDLEGRISTLLNNKRILPKPLSFGAWLEYLQKDNRTLVLIITEAEKLLNPIGKTILTLLSYMIDQYYPHVLVMSVFETQISHPTNMAFLPPSTRMYANIFEYPLYGLHDTELFIDLLEKEWNVSVAKEERQHIIKECGGHFWFVKEAVRRIAGDGAWSPNEEGMVFRLRTVFEQLIPSEQSLIKKMIAGKSDLTQEERISLDYLKGMNVIDAHGKRCMIGMLKDYVLQYEEKPSGIVMGKDAIYLNNVPIDKFFSRKELRVLRLLVEKEGNIVSRNDVATVIWPTDTEKEYSDWAIDQLIARLRKRLQTLYISPKSIRVIRGKGYMLSLSEHE